MKERGGRENEDRKRSKRKSKPVRNPDGYFFYLFSFLFPLHSPIFLSLSSSFLETLSIRSMKTESIMTIQIPMINKTFFIFFPPFFFEYERKKKEIEKKENEKRDEIRRERKKKQEEEKKEKKISAKIFRRMFLFHLFLFPPSQKF